MKANPNMSICYVKQLIVVASKVTIIQQLGEYYVAPSFFIFTFRLSWSPFGPTRE